MDFIALAQECAPAVEQKTLAAIVKVESGFNPYAIGVVNGKLVRQPKNKEEALATAKALDAAGWNYSVGIAQVNIKNLPLYNLTISDAFNPCANLRVGAQILNECHTRAKKATSDQREALNMAFSCYYSNNFQTGFIKPATGGPSYVEKVAANLDAKAVAIPVIPSKKEKEELARPVNSPVLLEQGGDKVAAEEKEAGNQQPKESVIVF